VTYSLGGLSKQTSEFSSKLRLLCAWDETTIDVLVGVIEGLVKPISALSSPINEISLGKDDDAFVLSEV
jgi:hypothetical protein